MYDYHRFAVAQILDDADATVDDDMMQYH